MWVIYCKDTGVEIDRVEHLADANNLIRYHNDADIFEYSYAKRWED